MGQGDNVVYPVSRTDRGISTAPYGSIIETLEAVTYSFGFYPYYEVVQTRNLGVGSLVNPAGNVVYPSIDSVVSAASDFDSEQTDLILGTSAQQYCCNGFRSFLSVRFLLCAPGSGANSWPLADYVWMMIYGSTQPECSVASALNGFIYWTQTSSDAETIAARYLIFPSLWIYIYIYIYI